MDTKNTYTETNGVRFSKMMLKSKHQMQEEALFGI
jgi:hypothetical protein